MDDLRDRRVWLRTFVPWQLVRFAIIDIKMLPIIWRNHHASQAVGRE